MTDDTNGEVQDPGEDETVEGSLGDVETQLREKLRAGVIDRLPRLFERGPGTVPPEELVLRFSHVELDPTQQVRVEAIRIYGLQFALFLKQNTPASREQSLAFTHLEDVVHNAIAAIARREERMTAEQLAEFMSGQERHPGLEEDEPEPEPVEPATTASGDNAPEALVH